MTSVPLPSMYANAAITFRDPFAARDDLLNRQPHQHPSYAPYNCHRSRPPTPPPDMNAVSHAARPSGYNQEQGQQYQHHFQGHQAHKLPAASVSYTDTEGYALPNTLNRAPSPANQTQVNVAHEPIFEPVTQKRPSQQSNAIAPSFQIPRTVNNSGGSLSELASQISCLFWFESSDLLQQVEDSPVPITPPRKLVRDAIPTTGFRKWVTTILSTTLVGANVVLLALLFIHRLKKLNPSVKGKPGSEYRLLTVALMLGNKFLDDNTYTNKTWAEVSGINVAEVHIMEVEFLSNMKYCLYTSADDWAEWQTVLGRYAAFFERATTQPRPASTNTPHAIFAPPTVLRLPDALPSPPASTQASPPFAVDPSPAHFPLPVTLSHGPTPVPSPLAIVPPVSSGESNPRKRSLEDYVSEAPAKRLASSIPDYASERYFPRSNQNQRSMLPTLPIPTSQSSTPTYSMPPAQTQLPPLTVPGRAMNMVFPSSRSAASTPQHAVAPSGIPPSHNMPQLVPQYLQSRQHSPHPGSSGVFPTSDLPLSSNNVLHPPTHLSPSYFLQQRSSPYRPVHNVSTLLHPPPSAALHQRQQHVEFDHMHYQPLGKPTQRQTGRLPYATPQAQAWYEGNMQHAPMAPQQWPTFPPQQQRHTTSHSTA